jgi:hypothetical protein
VSRDDHDAPMCVDRKLAWYALSVRYGLRADTANPTPAEADRLARQYPVFRLETAGSLGQGRQEDASGKPPEP